MSRAVVKIQMAVAVSNTGSTTALEGIIRSVTLVNSCTVTTEAREVDLTISIREFHTLGMARRRKAQAADVAAQLLERVGILKQAKKYPS
jgi:ABC-type histidine transport system ATPase subunit